MFTHGPLQRRAAWTRPLAVCLTLALIAPPAAQLLPTAQAQQAMAAPAPAAIKSILLFPAASTGDTAKALGPILDDAIQTRLSMVGTYKVTIYTKFLPSVQRAVSEADSGGGLAEADTRSPFSQADNVRAQKIAALVGTDSYLLTTIASYSQDATTRRVTLLVNSRVYDAATGAALPGMGGTFSGVAGPTAATDTDAAIQQGAINDVASRITSSLNAAAPHTGPVVVPSSKRGGRNMAAQYTIGAILLGVAIAAIISGSHFGGGGGGSTSTGTNSGTTGSSGGTTTGPPAPPAAPSLRH